MRITWYGQACFVLTTAQGTTIVCDPYDDSLGYPARGIHAQVVTISHEHHDHNCMDWISGEPVVLRGVGEFTAEDVLCRGYASFHDDFRGAKRGPNTIFVLEVDGLRLCHLGDLGHMPEPALLEELAQPDVLFLPIGGYYTIDHTVAHTLQQALQPALTIPMHFNTGVGNLPIATAEPFAVLTGAQYANAATIDVKPGQWTGETLILQYER